MHFLGEIIIMVLLKIFKNKKAFSLIELVVAMIIASIVMFSIYFMLIIAYEQFNDLTEASENFNNLQVFERTFQKSATSCSYYELNENTYAIKFVTPISNGSYKYEIYEFKNMGNDFRKINDFSQPYKYYSDDVNDGNVFSNINIDNNYKVIYTAGVNSNSFAPIEGYTKKSSTTFSDGKTDDKKVLFDNIVKVYYQTPKNITTSTFYKFTGVDLNDKWRSKDEFRKVYTPFIKLIIVYKDNKKRLRKFYITCRLKGIEGVEFRV